MGTIWRIDPKTQEREQITVKLGDIWKDGRRWKVRFPIGVHTEDTKARCEMWRRQMLKDGLINAYPALMRPGTTGPQLPSGSRR